MKVDYFVWLFEVPQKCFAPRSKMKSCCYKIYGLARFHRFNYDWEKDYSKL